MNRTLCRSLCCALLLFVLGDRMNARADDPELAIDLRSPRGEIRKMLLARTPVETNAAAVAKFIRKHLQPSADAEVAITDGPAPVSGDEKPRGAKFIRIYLGHYFDHPEVVFLSAPIMAQREVTAFWIFDQKARLIDIAVDKHTGVY